MDRTKEGSAVKVMYRGWNLGEMYKLHMEVWDTVKEGPTVREIYQPRRGLLSRRCTRGWNPGEMYKLHMEAWDTVKVGPTVKEMYVIKEMSEFRGMNRF